jgi:hypothetical protein
MSRNTDPETSRLAADRMIATKARDTHRDIVEAYCLAHPGLITREMTGSGLNEEQARKRVNELVKDGVLEYGVARSGQQTIWPVGTSHPIEGQERLL